MKRIKLTQGKFTLVDNGDFEWLNQWKWYLNSKGYAMRGKRISGKQIMILMHRLINNTPEGLKFETDHINRDKLDNRRENLRTATRSQNKINTNLRKDNTSGYKGVSWNKNRNRWMAQLHINGKHIHLGLYSTLQGAWLARKWGERIYFR